MRTQSSGLTDWYEGLKPLAQVHSSKMLRARCCPSYRQVGMDPHMEQGREETLVLGCRVSTTSTRAPFLEFLPSSDCFHSFAVP